MAQAKLRPRLYTVLFYVAVFLLTSVGLAALYYGMLPPSLLFILGYIMAWALLFALGVDFFGGEGKLNGKKVLVLTFVVMLSSTMFTHLIYTIVTPSWSFSVSTDKSTYGLGELVTIMVSLENMGLVSHSFKSISDPIVISIEQGFFIGPQVWFSRFNESVTEFFVESSDSLVRDFVWNQTNIHFPEEEIEPGMYYIRAFIPSIGSEEHVYLYSPLFDAYTRINITST